MLHTCSDINYYEDPHRSMNQHEQSAMTQYIAYHQLHTCTLTYPLAQNRSFFDLCKYM